MNDEMILAFVGWLITVRKVGASTIKQYLSGLLVIYLKSPKEEVISTWVNVELFATGTFSCPVSAWKKWRQVDKYRLSPTKPIFRVKVTWTEPE